MTKLSFTPNLNNVIALLLGLFLIFEHIPHMAGVKNISLYLALLITFYRLYKDKAVQKNFKINLTKNLLLISLLLTFVIYTLIISAMPYFKDAGSFKDAFGEFGRGVCFVFIILTYAKTGSKNDSNDSIKQAWGFYLAIIGAFLAVTLYYSPPLFTQFTQAWGDGGVESGRIISRSYADYVDRFLPFALAGVMIFDKTKYKILIFLLILVSLTMDILSGTRGSWLAAGVSALVMLLLLFFAGFASAIKKQLKIITTFAIILTILLVFVGINSSIFNFKYSQGADSSGRVSIITQRAPLFLSSQRAIWGLGYGKAQYDEFLRQAFDLGARIDMMQVRPNGTRYWFNDEPFWLGKFYYYGVIGTGALLGVYMVLLFSTFKEMLKQNDSKIKLIYIAIFVSLISYFGIRGLFECINLRELYLFYMAGFFIILRSNQNHAKS